MIKLIVGAAGTGKTKTIIDLVNTAAAEEKGSIVCVTSDNSLRFDISHGVRLIDASEYGLKTYDSMMGFVEGLHAGNYDITQIYLDIVCKIVDNRDMVQVEKFVLDLDAFAEKHGVTFYLAMTDEAVASSEVLKKYL